MTGKWKFDGVRVVHSNELDINTPQTPGMNRAAAITHAIGMIALRAPIFSSPYSVAPDGAFAVCSICPLKRGVSHSPPNITVPFR